MCSHESWHSDVWHSVSNCSRPAFCVLEVQVFPKGERRPSRLGSIYTRHIRHSKLLWQPHNRPTTTPGLVPSWSAIFCLSDAWCCFLFFILMIPDIHEKSVMYTYTLDCTISIHGMRVRVNIFIYMCMCVSMRAQFIWTWTDLNYHDSLSWYHDISHFAITMDRT